MDVIKSDELFKDLYNNLEKTIQNLVDTMHTNLRKMIEDEIKKDLKRMKGDLEHNKNLTKNMIETTQERIKSLV